MNRFIGIEIAAALLLVAFLTKRLDKAFIIAAIIVALIGAVFPAGAWIVGGISLIYVLFVHGSNLFSKVSSMVSGGSKKP